MFTSLRALLLALSVGLFVFYTTHCIASKMILTTQPINVPPPILNTLKSFEPSALVYLPHLHRYLVASDDTDEKDTPMGFLMDDHGNVESQPLFFQGLEKMTDIESVSADDQGFLYFMSSQSLNKNGKNKPERNLFVQASLNVQDIQVIHQIELRSILINAIQKSLIPELVAIKNKLGTDLDVESHFILKGELYVGLKNPQSIDQKALILNLGDVKNIFLQKKISNLNLWRTIDFSKISPKKYLLSETLLVQKTLFLATTTESGDGALWTLDLISGTLNLMEEFTGFRPEGLSYRPATNNLMVVFDQGESPAQFLLLNIEGH